MADMVIGDYTAAVTIDGSTHFLLIQPGNASTAYNKISRSVFLGVSGQPVDISTVQTISNKVLANSNSITVQDNAFTIQDNSDNTKQAVFQLSGITTATTRTYTLPDATTTIVGTGATQTLTNKTLTSPTINGGTIDNATITVDSVAGHTASTTGTIYGISVASGAIQSNAAIKDGIILPKSLQSGTGSTWAWATWTPTWTNITVGNGTVTALYIQVGKVVFFKLKFVLGSTSAVSGADPTFTFPVTSIASYANVAFSPIGHAGYNDSSAGGAVTNGAVTWNSTTTAALTVFNAGSTYVTENGLNTTVPFTWATSDSIFVNGFYEAA